MPGTDKIFQMKLRWKERSIQREEHLIFLYIYTGELGYDGPLYDGFLHMTDDMLGPSPMHIKYSS